jgi:hypothetical protein
VRGALLLLLLGGLWACATDPAPKRRGPAPQPSARLAALPRGPLPQRPTGPPVSDDLLLTAVPPALPEVEEPPLDELPDGPEVPELEAALEAAELGKHAKARDLAAEVVKAHAGDARVEIAARALMGRAGARLGKGADEAYGAVIAAFGRARPSLDAMEAAERAVVLDAAGEALVHFAEKKRRLVEPMPRYAGSGGSGDVSRFHKVEMKDWIDDTRERIAQAEAAYLEVMKLEPSPPSRWAMLSGLRMGATWASFAREFRGAPYPSDWDRPGLIPGVMPPTPWAELKNEFLLDVAQASANEVRRARQAFQSCVTFADKDQLTGPHRDACAAWLAHDPR